MTKCRVAAVLGTMIVIGTVAMSAQTARLEHGVQSQGDFDFYWETRLLPPMPQLGDGLRMVTLSSGTDTIHRIMLDRSRQVYFGYDARVLVKRNDDGASYTVTFGPLSLTPELQKTLGANAKNWKLLPAPKFPAPRTIRSGEVLELTLLTNDTWGQRLVEYVTVEAPQSPRRRLENGPREFAFTSGAPRDFVPADAVLRLNSPLVSFLVRDTVAGRRREYVTSLTGEGDESGSIVWLYVPNRGRFLLSLIPRGKWAPAGEVRGSFIKFTVDGFFYNVRSSSLIAPGHAAFNLYVLHQPGWKPTYENANLDTIHIGAADRLEYLVDKRFNFSVGTVF